MSRPAVSCLDLLGTCLSSMLLLALPARAQEPAQDEPAARTDVVGVLQHEADALADFVTSPLAREFLAATAHLPGAPARTLYRDPQDGRWLGRREAEALPAEEREALLVQELEPATFYRTKYGSPLAYCRAVDLLGATLTSLEGRRLLDFGYGTVGHLRLLAGLGADAVGVDVDPFLAALYAEPGDQGAIERAAGSDGRVTLLTGRWPADEATRAAVGSGYDVFLSKNTLKRGYVHPERETDPRRLIDLGVDDETFLRHLHELLVPGGLALIYNLSPPPAAPDEPYIPWADGRSPFTAEQWEAAGFELLAFDTGDDAAAREMGRRLGWGVDMDLEQGLFGHYTLARKPRPDEGR